MRSRTVHHIIAPLGFASLLLFNIIPYSNAANPCEKIVGDWSWFIGGKVSFSNNAQAKWIPGAAGMPPASGTWKCNPRSGTYTVTWQNGFVDTLNLSDDGKQLSGISSTGVKVSGKRASSAAGASPAGGSATTTPNPRTTPTQGQDGWTPIGPGGFGKQAPVPGAPQRIGPQGRPPPKHAG
jgi:hypothetical protein